jgi:hypothetical protein
MLNKFFIDPIAPTLPVFTVVVILGIFYFKQYVKFISQDEQLHISGLTKETIENGPNIVFLNPFTTRNCFIQKALSLGPLEYCVIKNILTGEKRVEIGPKLTFLKPYDKVKSDERTKLEKRIAISLKANEYVRFVDNSSGKVRVVQGERGCVVPEPDEQFIDPQGKLQAMDLKVYEYVKILNKNTGAVRTERGEKLVFLGPHDEFLSTKKSAIEIDDETSVLVRNKRNGQQYLVTEKTLFVPSDDEDIIEVRNLVKLADYEACIVRDKNGKDMFFFGKNESQRSFFLPPHSELVELLWSRGRRRERRDLRISKLDLRPMFMSFEFNCRTNDNVELILEGSFFWEVVDLESMVKFTNDTTGDICNHARSRFIELVSKVTLQEFMSNFNDIALKVHEGDSTNFYSQRGVKIHSLEVTGYRCASSSTAYILEQIIQETTNRMNRLQQQESENEVQLHQIRGDIDEENARSELITIQTMNSNAKAKMEGMAEAEKVKSFILQLTQAFPEMDLSQSISLWNTLRKEDALKAVSKGNASLYFTPSDVNLSIENHQHVTKDKNWADDSI